MKRQLAVATVGSGTVGVLCKVCRRTSSQMPNMLICCLFTAAAAVVPLLLLQNNVDAFLCEEFHIYIYNRRSSHHGNVFN